MTKTIINEFDEFLVTNFAKNEIEWTEYLDLVALQFLKTFYDNLEKMNQQLNPYSQKKVLNFSSSREKNKIESILRVFYLFEMIEINEKEEKIKVDFVQIKKSFYKINDANELQEVRQSVDDLNNAMSIETKDVAKEDHKSSFADLYQNYNFLISYVNEENVRQTFFKEFLLKDKKTDLLTITNNISYLSTQL